MGSSKIVLRASMNIFIIFGNVSILQINEFWKISKMPLLKPCEQRLPKTFYFGPPNFVEVLKVKWILCEFLYIL